MRTARRRLYFSKSTENASWSPFLNLSIKPKVEVGGCIGRRRINASSCCSLPQPATRIKYRLRNNERSSDLQVHLHGRQARRAWLVAPDARNPQLAARPKRPERKSVV